MRWIAHALRECYPRAFVFTNTKINGYWQKHLPSKFIFEGFMPGVLQRIMDEQRDLVEWWHANKHEVDFNPYLLLIFDDVVSQDLHHAPELKQLFYNGRHLKCLVMMSLQYAKGIPPGFRENIDQAFIFQLHSDNQVEAVEENFLGHYDPDAAELLLDTAIWQRQSDGQRQCLVVDTSGQFPKQEQLFLCQALDPGDFALGCVEIWDDDEPPEEPRADINTHPWWEARE